MRGFRVPMLASCRYVVLCAVWQKRRCDSQLASDGGFEKIMWKKHDKTPLRNHLYANGRGVACKYAKHVSFLSRAENQRDGNENMKSAQKSFPSDLSLGLNRVAIKAWTHRHKGRNGSRLVPKRKTNEYQWHNICETNMLPKSFFK